MVGAVMPGIIASLTLLDQEHLKWDEFHHVALFIFNIQSILTFSAFASYIWAREYEENMMEELLCYPFPKYKLFLSKLFILLPVIACTSLLFVFNSGVMARFLTEGGIPAELLVEYLLIIGLMILMHFMLMPFMLLVSIVSKQAVTGIVIGVVFMLVCTIFYNTSFIQYIPFIIPMVLTDHLLGFDKLILSGYRAPTVILLSTFVASLVGCLWLLKNSILFEKN
ncbi:ABC-2 family transporter protein [compost metagenome]